MSLNKRTILICFMLACAGTTLIHSVIAQQRSDSPDRAPLFSKRRQEEMAKLIEERPLAAAVLGVVSVTVVCAVLAGVALDVWYLISKALGRELLPRAPVRNVSWRVSDAVVILISYITVPLSVGLIWRALYGGDVNERWFHFLSLLLVAVVNVAIVLLVFGAVRYLRGGAVADLGLSKKDWRINLKRGVIGYLMALPILIGAALSAQSVLRLLGKEPSVQEIVEFIGRQDSPIVLAAIMIYGVALAPVLEEILFRGFLQAALRQRLGAKMGIGVTALLFALMHFNATVLAPIFVLGVALGFLYERTQSLVAPIALHAANNSATMAILIVAKVTQSRFL